jgi:hypothetical protein
MLANSKSLTSCADETAEAEACAKICQEDCDFFHSFQSPMVAAVMSLTAVRSHICPFPSTAPVIGMVAHSRISSVVSGDCPA